MRSLATTFVLALVASVAAIPITPAAPELQRRAEQMRLEGVPEGYCEAIIRSVDQQEVQPRPVISHLSSKLHAFLHTGPLGERDRSGDIAPGSLDAPDMLPQAPRPESFIDTIKGIFTGESSESREYAYEGKELEMRRPQGMRHWD